MGVDDECADFTFEWIRRLWNVSVSKMKSEYKVDALFDNIPEDMLDLWHDKFWHFETAKWTNKIDHRSLPFTCYNSEVHCIFEFMSYEIVDDMIDYIMRTCPKLTKKKLIVLDDLKPKLMVDTSKVKPKPNLKIPALEVSIQLTNERINRLDKLLNERLDELELFDSANFSKHENLIDELTQKIHDIEEVLNNHKEMLEKLNSVSII